MWAFHLDPHRGNDDDWPCCSARSQPHRSRHRWNSSTRMSLFMSRVKSVGLHERMNAATLHVVILLAGAWYIRGREVEEQYGCIGERVRISRSVTALSLPKKYTSRTRQIIVSSRIDKKSWIFITLYALHLGQTAGHEYQRQNVSTRIPQESQPAPHGHERHC